MVFFHYKAGTIKNTWYIRPTHLLSNGEAQTHVKSRRKASRKLTVSSSLSEVLSQHTYTYKTEVAVIQVPLRITKFLARAVKTNLGIYT